MNEKPSDKSALEELLQPVLGELQIYPERPLDFLVKDLLQYDPADEDSAKTYHLGKTLWQRETHSKSGEHIFVAYNDHSASEQYISPQFFILVYGPQHAKTVPKLQEDYRWTEKDDLDELFADKIERIKQLLDLFKNLPTGNNGG